jgi:2',3'-cyclic-nucleotide 2'-phosphodiesterase (5'-nucleotidase family)
MRRLIAIVALAGCGASTVEPPLPTPPPESEIQLTIVGTNDLHGHVEKLPIFAGYLENLAGQTNVLLVDGGDMFQGTIASNLGEGAVVIRAYNALSYHAAAVGNHEFDYGPRGDAVTPQAPGDDPRGALKARAAEANFPLLTANILDRASGERVDWGESLPATTRVTIGTIDIGIVGVSTAETLVTTIAGNVADLAMAPLAETITAHAERLRREGAAVIVVAAHAGAACDEHLDPDDLRSCDDGEIFRVARDLPRDLVDVIVAGHTHRGVAHRVNGVAIIESFAYGEAFGRVDLTLRDGRVVESKIHPPQPLCTKPVAEPCETVPYAGKPVVADPAIEALVAPDLARAKAIRDEPLGVELAAAFEAHRGRETPLSRLLADLMREARPSDVAVINGGGIRASLPAGPLRYGDFYEAFPFDNRFARVELSGAELESLIASDLASDRGILTFSGIRGRADCAGGAIAISLSRDDGRPIAKDERIAIVTSDYLATSVIPAFASARSAGRVTVEEGEPIRETLAALLKARHRLDPATAPLIESRIVHPGRPMRCDG